MILPSLRAILPDCKAWNNQYDHDAPVYEMDESEQMRFYHSQTIYSNVMVSLSSKTKLKTFEQGTFNMDTDSYTMAIDTCTSESICNKRDLFVGTIKKYKYIYIYPRSGWQDQSCWSWDYQIKSSRR